MSVMIAAHGRTANLSGIPYPNWIKLFGDASPPSETDGAPQTLRPIYLVMIDYCLFDNRSIDTVQDAHEAAIAADSDRHPARAATVEQWHNLIGLEVS